METTNFHTPWVYKPVSIEIEMTHQCNLRCHGCAILDDVVKEKYKFSEKEILNILEQARDIHLLGYCLTGGEPFIDFELLKNIIHRSPIDLIKINTNGYIFSSPKKTIQVLKELKESGFGVKNRQVISWLHISIGQQTSQGIPLENTVFVAREFYNIFPREKAAFSLNVFSPSQKYSYLTIKTFLRKYREITGIEFNVKKNPIKLIPSDGRYCNTSFILRNINREKIKIKDLIREYLDDKNLLLNCEDVNKILKERYIGPRILLRADGNIYSCTGFAHVHRLGNIRKEKLKDILELERTSSNQVLKIVFQKRLSGLLDLAEKYQPGIGNKKISISHGPCDICRLLTNIILNVTSHVY